MDRASLIGIALALIAIFGGFVMEGGHLRAIVQPTAALIVFGGTIGALFLQFPMQHMRMALKDLRSVFVEAEDKPLRELLDTMLAFAKTAHREGLQQLEPEIERVDDPFLSKALTLAVDGAPPDTVRHSLDLELDAKAEQSDLGARVFEAGGGYAPTVGILGAVLGLIHVMENLSEPEQLGGGIAVAFVATVYGVGLANLILLPVAGKIRVRNQVIFQRYEFIVEATVAMVQGEHPTTIGDRLEGLLDDEPAPAEPAPTATPPTEPQADDATSSQSTPEPEATPVDDGATAPDEAAESPPADLPEDS